MYCRNHPTKTAANTCSHCGDWLCEMCTADVGGRIYCGACLQQHWVGHETPPAPPKSPPYYAPRHEGRRGVSFGLLLFFSLFFPPGVNYMYQGLIKRGLFFLSGFFLLIYLASALNGVIFGLAIPVMVITCAFDAFRIRNRMLAGETVADSVDDVLGFIKRYRTFIVLFLLVIIGLNVLDSISFAFRHFPHFRHIPSFANRGLLPILVFFGGMYLLVTSGKRSKPHEAAEHRDDQ